MFLSVDEICSIFLVFDHWRV